jgi:hypothetical protein
MKYNIDIGKSGDNHKEYKEKMDKTQIHKTIKNKQTD